MVTSECEDGEVLNSPQEPRDEVLLCLTRGQQGAGLWQGSLLVLVLECHVVISVPLCDQLQWLAIQGLEGKGNFVGANLSCSFKDCFPYFFYYSYKMEIANK